MSLRVDEFTAKRLVYETSLPFDTVTARLDEQLSLEKSGPNMIALLRGAKTREDLEQGMTNMTNGKDFAYATPLKHVHLI